MCVCGCACVRACVRVGALPSLLCGTRACFSAQKPHKCRVRLRSFLFFWGGGVWKRIKTFSTERNDYEVGCT